MTREKKLFLNTITSIVFQVLTVLCGLILPRFYLLYYGSNANGLVASITQFLGFITLCECGVGAVIQSAFYKPLADKDDYELSKIVKSSDRFFKCIALILLIYVFVLCIVYPYIISSQFDTIYTISLVIIIALSSFSQYFFGATSRLLLNADQMGYIQYLVKIIGLIVNTFLCLVLMRIGCQLHIVKFLSSMIFIIQPIILNLYVKKNYSIDYRVKLEEEPIKQKWNGLAQHISYVVLQNTDIIVLTIFSSLANVSIYGVYFNVVNGVSALLLAMLSSFEAIMGELYAKKKKIELKNSFSFLEWISHLLTAILFSITGLLIVPFVMIYTSGINDANYYVPVFGGVITVAYASYCIQIPYNLLIHAMGHYKQTQKSSIIEAVINIVISIITVSKFGLIGVAIGTACAMIYRVLFFVWYLSNNGFEGKTKDFLRQTIVDVITVTLIIVIGKFVMLKSDNIISWVLSAIILLILAIVISVSINTIFYKKYITQIVKVVKEKIRT